MCKPWSKSHLMDPIVVEPLSPIAHRLGFILATGDEHLPKR